MRLEDAAIQWCVVVGMYMTPKYALSCLEMNTLLESNIRLVIHRAAVSYV